MSQPATSAASAASPQRTPPRGGDQLLEEIKVLMHDGREFIRYINDEPPSRILLYLRSHPLDDDPTNATPATSTNPDAPQTYSLLWIDAALSHNRSSLSSPTAPVVPLTPTPADGTTPENILHITAVTEVSVGRQSQILQKYAPASNEDRCFTITASTTGTDSNPAAKLTLDLEAISSNLRVSWLYGFTSLLKQNKVAYKLKRAQTNPTAAGSANNTNANSARTLWPQAGGSGAGAQQQQPSQQVTGALSPSVVKTPSKYGEATSSSAAGQAPPQLVRSTSATSPNTVAPLTPHAYMDRAASTQNISESAEEMVYEMTVKCKALPKPTQAVCNPIVCLFIGEAAAGAGASTPAVSYKYFDQTEIQLSTLSPNFTKQFLLDPSILSANGTLSSVLLKLSVYNLTTQTIHEENRLASVDLRLEELVTAATGGKQDELTYELALVNTASTTEKAFITLKLDRYTKMKYTEMMLKRPSTTHSSSTSTTASSSTAAPSSSPHLFSKVQRMLTSGRMFALHTQAGVPAKQCTIFFRPGPNSGGSSGANGSASNTSTPNNDGWLCWMEEGDEFEKSVPISRVSEVTLGLDSKLLSASSPPNLQERSFRIKMQNGFALNLEASNMKQCVAWMFGIMSLKNGGGNATNGSNANPGTGSSNTMADEKSLPLHQRKNSFAVIQSAEHSRANSRRNSFTGGNGLPDAYGALYPQQTGYAAGSYASTPSSHQQNTMGGSSNSFAKPRLSVHPVDVSGRQTLQSPARPQNNSAFAMMQSPTHGGGSSGFSAGGGSTLRPVMMNNDLAAASSPRGKPQLQLSHSDSSAHDDITPLPSPSSSSGTASGGSFTSAATVSLDSYRISFQLRVEDFTFSVSSTTVLAVYTVDPTRNVLDMLSLSEVQEDNEGCTGSMTIMCVPGSVYIISAYEVESNQNQNHIQHADESTRIGSWFVTMDSLVAFADHATPVQTANGLAINSMTPTDRKSGVFVKLSSCIQVKTAEAQQELQNKTSLNKELVMKRFGYAASGYLNINVNPPSTPHHNNNNFNSNAAADTPHSKLFKQEFAAGASSPRNRAASALSTLSVDTQGGGHVVPAGRREEELLKLSMPQRPVPSPHSSAATPVRASLPVVSLPAATPVAAAAPTPASSSSSRPTPIQRMQALNNQLSRSGSSAPPVLFGTSVAGALLHQSHYGVHSPDLDFDIPLLLSIILRNIIEHNGHKSEGIFRLSPPSSSLTHLIQDLEQGNYSLTESDPNLNAGLLKHWIRSLSIPIIPIDQYERMITLGKKGDTFSMKNAKDEAEFKLMTASMSEPHSKTLLTLLLFLKELLKYESSNRMTSRAFGVIFAPSLVRMTLDPNKQTPQQLMKEAQNMTYATAFFQKMIDEAPGGFDSEIVEAADDVIDYLFPDDQGERLGSHLEEKIAAAASVAGVAGSGSVMSSAATAAALLSPGLGHGLHSHAPGLLNSTTSGNAMQFAGAGGGAAGGVQGHHSSIPQVTSPPIELAGQRSQSVVMSPTTGGSSGVLSTPARSSISGMPASLQRAGSLSALQSPSPLVAVTASPNEFPHLMRSSSPFVSGGSPTAVAASSASSASAPSPPLSEVQFEVYLLNSLIRGCTFIQYNSSTGVKQSGYLVYRIGLELKNPNISPVNAKEHKEGTFFLLANESQANGTADKNTPCVKLSDIKKLVDGKVESKVWEKADAAHAQAQCCWSLVGKKVTFDLEAESARQKLEWLYGIRILMSVIGKEKRPSVLPLMQQQS